MLYFAPTIASGVPRWGAFISGTPPDTTLPVMSGVLSASAVTTTTYTLSGWSATDNLAVTGYELSLDGGTVYNDIGLVTTRGVTGRTAGTTDQVRVRAYDAAGNKSTPLSLAVTLLSNAPPPPPPPPPPIVVTGNSRIILLSNGQLGIILPG